MSEDIKLYPAWRQALADMVDGGLLKPGSVITREWLTEHFGIKNPETIPEYERAQLDFLRQFSEMREALLEDHLVMLRPVIGIGYEVVPPEQQTRRAVSDRMHRINREARKLSAELSFVNREALSDSARADNSNALAKLGALSTMLGRKRIHSQTEPT